MVLAATAAAQNNNCQRRRILIRVTTAEGESTPDPSGTQITGTFRGKPVKVLSVVPHRQPLRIVILLDASASMLRNTQKDSPWSTAVQLAYQFIQGTPAETQFGLLIFGSDVHRTVAVQQGGTAVLKELAVLPSIKEYPKKSRQTALWDTIHRALDMLGPPQAGDVIYAITDGQDNQSRKRRRHLERALIQAQTRLFVTATKTVQPEPLRANEIVPDTIGELRDTVHASGGALSDVQAEEYGWTEVPKAGVEALAKRLYHQMTDVNWVEIELPVPVDKPRDLKLELVPPPGKKKNPLALNYPRKLLPCAKP
jgi:hypothetical protein